MSSDGIVTTRGLYTAARPEFSRGFAVAGCETLVDDDRHDDVASIRAPRGGRARRGARRGLLLPAACAAHDYGSRSRHDLLSAMGGRRYGTLRRGCRRGRAGPNRRPAVELSHRLYPRAVQ